MISHCISHLLRPLALNLSKAKRGYLTQATCSNDDELCDLHMPREDSSTTCMVQPREDSSASCMVQLLGDFGCIFCVVFVLEGKQKFTRDISIKMAFDQEAIFTQSCALSVYPFGPSICCGSQIVECHQKIASWLCARKISTFAECLACISVLVF